MSNEELVQKIKSGEKDFMTDLWDQVRRFIHKQAYLFILRSSDNTKVELDDLVQSGYLALCSAIKNYDPDAGCSFIGYLSFYLRHQFRKEIGTRTSRRDVLLTAESLNKPISEDNDELHLIDAVPCPEAELAFDDMLEQLEHQRIMNIVFECMQRLSPRHRDILILAYLKQAKQDEIAEQLGIVYGSVRRIKKDALRELRKRPAIARIQAECILDGRTNFYKRKGYTAFNSSFSSAVEDLVLKREELARRADILWDYESLRRGF